MADEEQKKRGHLGAVVVIGGNGFLGHHIVNQALSSAWATTSVTSIDLRCSQNVNPAAQYRECDITDEPRLASLLDEIRPDVVIHTASPAISGSFAPSHEILRKVNIDGTRSVIRACQKAAVKALVYTSSASVISDNYTDLVNADESYPTVRGAQQNEYYSETKAAAEELVLAANRQESSSSSSSSSSSPSFPSKPLLTTSLRPSGIFGEGDVQTLAGFLRVLRDGKSHIQVGDNNNMFDFTYVGNVAHAHLLAAHALLATADLAPSVPLDHERVDGEVFFVTNDSPCCFWDFARSIWRAAGSDKGTDGVMVLPRGLGLVLGSLSEFVAGIMGKPATFTRHRIVTATMTRYFNIAKAKRVLRYEPRWTLAEGISHGVTWFLEQEKVTKA